MYIVYTVYIYNYDCCHELRVFLFCHVRSDETPYDWTYDIIMTSGLQVLSAVIIRQLAKITTQEGSRGVPQGDFHRGSKSHSNMYGDHSASYTKLNIQVENHIHIRTKLHQQLYDLSCDSHHARNVVMAVQLAS